MKLRERLIVKVSEDIDKYLPVYNALYEENFNFDRLEELYRQCLENIPEPSDSSASMGKRPYLNISLSLDDDLYLGKIIYIHKVLKELNEDNKEYERAYHKAKKMLVLYNDVLPAKIVGLFMNRGIEREDLLQEGTMKLMTAVDRYDYRLGNKFVTYATYWVRQGMNDFIHTHSKTIRKPTHIIGHQIKINNAKQALQKETGMEPTTEEISKITGLTVEQILNIQRVSQDTVSFHATNPENDEFNFENLISDESILEELVIDNSLKEAIQKAIETLDEREKIIITLRYGLIDDRRMTLEEVGKVVNLTKERVRQIEAKALRNLRHPSRSKFLKDYV